MARSKLIIKASPYIPDIILFLPSELQSIKTRIDELAKEVEDIKKKIEE